MSILSSIHLVAFIGDIALIIFVLEKNHKELLNRFCALLAAAFAIWSLGYCFTQEATDVKTAMFWMSISSIGWVTFPIAAYYFYLALAGKEKILKNRFIPIVLAVIAIFFVYEQWAGNLVADVIKKDYGWAGVWSDNVYTYLLYAYIFGMIIFFIYLIFNFGRKAKTNREKIQAKLLLITASIFASLGFLTDVILPNMQITVIPDLANVFVFIWAIGIVICITRYGLMSVTPITAAEQILNTTTDMLLLLETDGRIKQSNHATINLLEFNEEEIKGSYFNTIFTHKEKADILLEKTRKNGKSVNEELSLKTKNGENIMALVSTSIVWDRLGTIIGFVVSAKDITELNKTQASLRQQKELIDRILDTTPNAVLVINRDSIVEFTNKAFCDGFHKNELEVVGKPVNIVLPLDSLLQEISKVKSLNKPRTKYEFKYMLANTESIFVTSILPMEKEEILVLLNNITEERNRQERLYLTDRLASIGEMASGIAHEINNPLTSIIGLSSILTNKELPKDVAEDLLDIKSEAQRCAAIVKNLLSFARKHISERQPLNILNIIEDVIKLRAYDHEKNNISVEFKFPPDIPQIFADYYQMQQVFLNIILNAESEMIEAHQRGILKIAGESIDNKVIISFSDDGLGIPAKYLRMIFDPFFTTKEVGKGTGLGLSICYGIIASHGGRIYAKSEYGHGATFVVELPICHEEVI